MKEILNNERIYDEKNDTQESAEQHYQLIKKCTDKHKNEWISYNLTKNKI
jgi:hypothetical protein